MCPGYRGQTFKARAESLQSQDWAGFKDFAIAIGMAVDKLEQTTCLDTESSVDDGADDTPSAPATNETQE